MILTNCRFLISAYDVSGQTNKGTLNFMRAVKEVTNFGSGGNRENKIGLFDGNYSLDAFYDADPFDAAIQANMSGTQVVTVSPVGGAVSDSAYFFKAVNNEVNREFALGEVGTASLSGSFHGRMVRGTVAEAGTTLRTADGTGADLTLGAVATGKKLYAALHVLSVSGGVTVSVESDVDNTYGTPTTQLTFATATSPGAEFKSTAGPITDTHFRVKWDLAGGSDTALVLVTLGIAD